MTCIVGIKTACGRVVIGADSAGVSGQSLTVRLDPKVFEVDGIVFGCTDSFRMIQLLRFGMGVPDIVPGLDLYEWAVRRLVPLMRKTFKAGGFAKKKDEVESGGCFLVGVRDRLFRIDSDYQVGEAHDPFESVGCGGSIALGALAALVDPNTPPSRSGARKIASRALKVAERFSAGVRGPYVLVESRK